MKTKDNAQFGNPLLEEFQKHHDKCGRWEYLQSEESSKQYAWSVPTPEALSQVAAGERLIEIGCGTGYWGRLWRDRGIDCLLYDINPPQEGSTNKSHPNTECWTEVLPGDETKLAEHADRTLVLMWPFDGVATRSLDFYQGNRLIYVGQPNGGHHGRTGGEEFESRLKSGGWILVKTLELPHWVGRTDRMYVYERKNS